MVKANKKEKEIKRSVVGHEQGAQFWPCKPRNLQIISMIKGNKSWETVNLQLETFLTKSLLSYGCFNLYHINTDESYCLIFIF